ncbi:MAG: metallothionein [Synechococcaceae cyanobacterium SM2_3_2]|nr:metallothionein [Synechococcaceae cyanobacterium SM2_3_2]
MTLTAERPVACACDHCNCQFEPSTGHAHEGNLYCSEACATHDHHHPSDCCVASHCCQ